MTRAAVPVARSCGPYFLEKIVGLILGYNKKKNTQKLTFLGV
nr:MAG TPA: hypothetical protein [Caudoviricetes sp.]